MYTDQGDCQIWFDGQSRTKLMNQIWIAGVASTYDNMRLSRGLYEQSNIEHALQAVKVFLDTEMSLKQFGTLILGLSRIAYGKTVLLNRMVNHEQWRTMFASNGNGVGGCGGGGVSILAKGTFGEGKSNRKRPTPASAGGEKCVRGSKLRRIYRDDLRQLVGLNGDNQCADRDWRTSTVPDVGLATKLSLRLYDTGKNLMTMPLRRNTSRHLISLFTRIVKSNNKRNSGIVDTKASTVPRDNESNVTPVCRSEIDSQCQHMQYDNNNNMMDKGTVSNSDSANNGRQATKAYLNIELESISTTELFFQSTSRRQQLTSIEQSGTCPSGRLYSPRARLHFTNRIQRNKWKQSTSDIVGEGNLVRASILSMRKHISHDTILFDRLVHNCTRESTVCKQTAVKYFVCLLQLANENLVQINQIEIGDISDFEPTVELYCTFVK